MTFEMHPSKEAFEMIQKGLSYVQDPKTLYVCIRKRGPDGADPDLVKRLGPFSAKEGLKELERAIRNYGSTFKVVIEPMEYKGWKNAQE